MSLQLFAAESAKFIYADRPDVYQSLEEAQDTVNSFLTYLSSIDPENDGSIGTAGFEMIKTVDDGCVEYVLNRKVTAFTVFLDEEESLAYDWTRGGSLTGGIVNIPDPDFEDPID